MVPATAPKRRNLCDNCRTRSSFSEIQGAAAIHMIKQVENAVTFGNDGALLYPMISGFQRRL
jgi:transcriptional regulator NrdR family protein